MRFLCREDGQEIYRDVVLLDTSDQVKVTEVFLRQLLLHKELGKPLPPWQTLGLFYEANRLYWLVDDVGLIFAIFDSDHSAGVHITFWDRRLRGREYLCRSLAELVLERPGMCYLHTSIPETSRATLAFAKRIGFEPVMTGEDGMVRLVIGPQAFHRETPKE